MAVDERAQLEVRQTFDPSIASYKKWDDDLIRLVKNSIMPAEATNADTYFLLELAGRYGLDPFAREIWAAKMKGKTGEKGGVTILVGRDGLLSIAEKHPQYRGFRNQPVYKEDTFAYSDMARKMEDGSHSHVSHSFDVTADRGELLGAWAEVYREGRPPVFFWAPLSDYLPKSERKLEYSPWSTTLNAMISKCALATALRLAFRITGLYIQEEMVQAMVPPGDEAYAAPAWPEDAKLTARLSGLFAAAEEAKPGSWLPGKVTATLERCETEEDYLELAATLELEIVATGGTVPPVEAMDAEFDRVVVVEGEEQEPEVEDAEFAAVEGEDDTIEFTPRDVDDPPAAG